MLGYTVQLRLRVDLLLLLLLDINDLLNLDLDLSLRVVERLCLLLGLPLTLHLLHCCLLVLLGQQHPRTLAALLSGWFSPCPLLSLWLLVYLHQLLPHYLLLFGRPHLVLHVVRRFRGHVLLHHLVIGLAMHIASIAALLHQGQFLSLLWGCFLLLDGGREGRLWLLLPTDVVALGGLADLDLVCALYLGLGQDAFHEVVHLLLLG